MNSPYLVPLARLRHHQGPLVVDFVAPFDEDHVFAPRAPADSDVFADAPVHVALRLEPEREGLRVSGRVSAPWHGVCRRCSAPVLGVADVAVSERFVERRVEGDEESYLFEGGGLDLGALARDAILLELPLAPLCRPECRGLCSVCGADRNETVCTCSAPRDPRWATLDGLAGPEAGSIE